MSPIRRRTSPGALAGAFATGAALLLSAACGGGGEESGSADGGGDGAFPITVEHAMGETTIESAPETVVVLDNSYLDSAIALGMDVVGRTDYYDGGDLRDYLGDEGTEYAGDAASLGTLEAPDMAAIAELQPDLILSAKVRHEDIYEQLSKIAPTVFSETTGATWKQNHIMVGGAVGKKDEAERQIAAYEERAAELGDRIAEASGGEMPTMNMVRFAGEPTVRLYQPESFPGIVQADVGVPMPEDAPEGEDGAISADLGPEEILDLDADHIYVSTWDDGTGDAADKSEEFTGNPLWDQLEGEKHEVDDRVWAGSVSLQGADAMLDDMAEGFGVDPVE
ncbi:ABC transporter substrate-binding protein [Nocardiopsis suaedae]|uniref:Iron-siderophore ABC transporter substrate-binding protein n=1 Tax=Nocardiopsis suaedae TaxID=3018444 RepID=A0ABT4TFZ0_9ACTN|nr:iron-siderophore ABC transporter substrate-binding protein [Nocardiopsis suaedae]MDA2803037.1 iron-siderophore ABC transporter substrate-binding protein [Nocardiopsis suaedae]